VPELKNIRVREAKARDRGLFRKLWKKFMEEQAGKGELILPNEKNLDFYTSLFNLYVSGEVQGTVLFVADQAVSMWGDQVSYLDQKPGRGASCWGMYVEPENRRRGISNAFHEKAKEILAAQGFDFCSTAHLFNDDIAVKNSDGDSREITKVSTNVYWMLKE
jgi:GNAT superfamily N-acetyltransferase